MGASAHLRRSGPTANPPGVEQALWPIPGVLLALAVSHWRGWRVRAHDD